LPDWHEAKSFNPPTGGVLVDSAFTVPFDFIEFVCDFPNISPIWTSFGLY
jgi:hypothetical protein